MTKPEPIEITPDHRSRSAVVYVRTATAPHRPEDFARLQAQRDQAGHARAWGWPESAILVIEDVAWSGTATEPPGWQRLLELVGQGQVGLVLATDASRLSRSWKDLAVIRGLCKQMQTLVVLNGTVWRCDPHDRFMAAIQQDFARYDRQMRVFLRRGARPGPSGMVNAQDQFAPDPDRAAREVLGTLASHFTQGGTIGTLSEDAARLTTRLPRPAARLREGVVCLLEEFDLACDEEQGDVGSDNDR